MPFINLFVKPEYLVPVSPLDGAQRAGDLNASYQQIFLPVAPNLELLILGEFPRARYFSISLYDDHGALLDVLDDVEIEPLIPGQNNPYRVGGTPGAEDILYAVTVQLGPQVATNPSNPDCAFAPLNVHTNLMDARIHHTAGTYYSCQQSGFSAEIPTGTVIHDDELANNRGATVMLRTYLGQAPGQNSQFNLTKPLVWLRHSSSGCSFPLASPGTFVDPDQWYRSDTVTYADQFAAHTQHEKDLGYSFPYGTDALNGVVWLGSPEYLLRALEDRYITAFIPYDSAQYPNPGAELNAESRVMRLLLRVPTVPCNGAPDCLPTGNEQLRYRGLSFVDQNNYTFASVADNDLHPDLDGYVSLIVTFGTPLPAHVTPENGYTVLALPEQSFRQMTLRNLRPSPDFTCSNNNVPHRTAEHHANGGYMGEYSPFVVFPTAASLPPVAAPFPQGGTCLPPAPPPDPC